MVFPALLLALATETAPRVIEITASRFRFEPQTVEVTEGESVALVLRSTDVSHGIEIKAYKLKLNIPKGGEPVRLEFVADRPGSFDFACSKYCGSGHRGMRGRLVVAPRPK